MTGFNGRVELIRETHPIMFRVSDVVVLDAINGIKGMWIGLEIHHSYEGADIFFVVDDWFNRTDYFVMFRETNRTQAMLFRLQYECEAVDASPI